MGSTTVNNDGDPKGWEVLDQGRLGMGKAVDREMHAINE
jgi:hypothetical protein